MVRVSAMGAICLALFACDAILGLDEYGSGGQAGAVAGAGGEGGLGGAVSTGGSGGTVPWLSPYPSRRRLVLDTTIANADVVDFSTPIVIAADSELAAQAQPDGRDIAFTSADGVTRLSHEIERYDGTTGELVAWVRLPSIHAADTTQIYLYFGDSAASDQQDVAGTWPSNIYRGVWHLSDNPAGAPPQMRDSTDHGSHGTITGAPPSVQGKAAAALAFDGGSDNVTVPDADHLDGGPAGFSYSCWVRAADSVTSGDRPLQKIGGASSHGYIMRLGDGMWTSELRDGTVTVPVSFGSEATFVDQWVQLAVVVDATNGNLVAYANGAVSDARSLGTLALAMLPNAEPLYISAPGGPFVGDVDEVRVYDVALGEDWLALEHHALTFPNYLDIGSVEAGP